MFQYSFTERTVPVPVSVPGKRFRRFRFRVRFLQKRFRRFRFPLPVRFLGHPEIFHRSKASPATCFAIYQERKSSLNIKFLGRIFLGHPGPRRQDIPDKNCMQVAFCCFRQEVAGMSRDWVVLYLENFVQENLG